MSPRTEIILRRSCAELVILFKGSALPERLRITTGYLTTAVRYIIIIIIITLIIIIYSTPYSTEKVLGLKTYYIKRKE
jgi:hypothetical protein